MNAVDRLKTSLQNELDSAQRAVDNFIGKLQEDAAYALKWGDSGFENAAHVAVCKEVLGYLNSERFDGNLRRIADHLREETIRKAASPEFSTSPTSNLMALYRNKSMAQVTGMVHAYAKMA